MPLRQRCGKAVKRNRIKRLIRETYRINKNMISGGYSIVFLAKKKCDIALISFKDVEEDLKKILEEIGKNE